MEYQRRVIYNASSHKRIDLPTHNPAPFSTLTHATMWQKPCLKEQSDWSFD